MILSKDSIYQYIKWGGLSFHPIPSQGQFQPSGIDLILEEVKLIRNGVDVNFWLARTREMVVMPNNLLGDVALKSTHARGIQIMPNTKVDPGFHGTITLEIWAWKDIVLPVGKPFVHFILHELTSPTEPYHGKYQNQLGITGAIND